ncbi:hypothetical protein QBZ16_005168 [Prototheca wickerhamii]|uniref:Nudix hydrolase domain-containing protein n=1 Tax=Prototheca wickerhamii TaxID=3111 RepID=A0AAD9IHZ5_PROWI|nr:hypothetical protein QBZ16_005168 [Prototheca wickerhamii]
MGASAKTVQGLARWLERCNAREAVIKELVPFTITGHDKPLGYMLPSFAEVLLGYQDVFQSGQAAGSKTVTLHPQLRGFEERTAAVDRVLVELQGKGVVNGWRGERYPVLSSFHSPPLLALERAAAVSFGIKAYGVHINGFVRMPDGALEMWVATRSRTKPTWPGRLDQMVAGGQPVGISCEDNVKKECWEEAGVPRELAAQAEPVGAVSYAAMQSAGLKRDVLFCYDLELPLDFTPTPQDDEVESFERWPMARLIEEVAHGDRFKDNCNLVIIDFFFRHGLVAPDTPGYLELLTGLRGGDCC